MKENTEVVFQFGPRQCPSCGSYQVRRSQRRGPGDYIVGLFMLRPFRCIDCQGRHHGFWFRRYAPQDSQPVNQSV